MIKLSFPKVFGTTAGPFGGGVGGMTITDFQIFLVRCELNKEVMVYANGRFWKCRKDIRFNYPEV